jgi:DMSO/TMAO reductase YedYZ molybdopterin-dependent catalytic subunit
MGDVAAGGERYVHEVGSALNVADPPLSTSPEIRATPLEALRDPEMPGELHFVRNHFALPSVDAESWRLTVGGAVREAVVLSLDDLKRLGTTSLAVTLECAGHRRAEFQPPASGVQWQTGAVSEARWTGVALSEVLRRAQPSRSACEVALVGADSGTHSGTGEHVSFARSIPLPRALHGDVLLAWGMNGQPLPARHGAPLRVVVPGAYAVASVKWLQRIDVLEHAFDGPFQAQDYRVDGESIEQLNVNALITSPAPGTVVEAAGTLLISGIAWGGQSRIDRVDVRVSSGPWRQASLTTPHPPYGLTHWRVAIPDAPSGDQTIEVRASDESGRVQPARPSWNALGYANNSTHRVDVTVVD